MLKKRLILFFLICIVSSFILYFFKSKSLTQEPDSIETPSSLKTGMRSFLDSGYKSLDNAEIFSEQEIQTHPYTTSNDQCNKCHEVYKTTGANGSYIVFVEDSHKLMTYACIKCHLQGNADHPIMIVASFPVPRDLPLSQDNEVTCITCHNPHLQRYSNHPWLQRSFMTIISDFISRKKQYKTFFLRRNNSNRELCLSCHHRVGNQFQFLLEPQQ